MQGVRDESDWEYKDAARLLGSADGTQPSLIASTLFILHNFKPQYNFNVWVKKENIHPQERMGIFIRR